MSHRTDPQNPGIETGDVISGFHVDRIIDYPEIHAWLYELNHERSGARHIHISRDDDENTFSIALKTVPRDNTGVAHILEHLALCGSQKYPVRDPFFSMLKRSLSTFMNAFTASDWTMYPFSTQNRKDFYNLMDVYLDAVFFPKLDRLSFKQEGHRLSFVDPEDSAETGKAGSGELIYSGVVYNEMKGAMSSPDQVCRRSLLNALFPDTTYRFNSGGDPVFIPELTHEQLMEFHRRHYHPSNAFFYTYGNLPLKDHLPVICDKVLAGVQAMDPDTHIPAQPRWHEPRQTTYYYPIGKQENPEKKSQACVAWLTADIKDSFEVLVLTLLEAILLGNAASPLRKALIDSGLGSALSDATGFDPDNRDTVFAAGLKDIAPESAEKIETIIFDVLNELVQDGVDRELVLSAIHQIEFHRKEVTNTPYPYGLKLLLSFCGIWAHGGDPVRGLQFDADVTQIKKAVEIGGFFENKIQQYFINNPHRVLFKLEPDPKMAGREESRIRKTLAQLQSQLGQAEIDAIHADNRTLVALQEGKEDIHCLPTLTRTDILPTVRNTPVADFFGSNADYCYDTHTSGITYFSSAMGIGKLDIELLPLVPFFCYAVTKVGTARHDYLEIARKIEAGTGGLGLGAHARTKVDAGGSSFPFVLMEGKCLDRNQSKLFELLEEFACAYDFSNLDRLGQVLREYRAGFESIIVQNGHRLAMSLAGRRFLNQSALSEMWHGVSQLRYIKALMSADGNDYLEILSKNLAKIGPALFKQGNMKTAIIGESDVLKQGAELLNSLLGGLSASGEDTIDEVGNFASPSIGLTEGVPREGWQTSTAVSFVAQTFQSVRMDHGDAPVLAIIAKMLRSLFLHREIREKGGAYGGFAVHSPEDGLFSLASYRDPHIVSTLKVFQDAFAFIRNGDFSNQDIDEAVLQVCSDIDKPDTPGLAARKAFYRQLLSLTDDLRNQYKQGVLAATRDQVLSVAERYFSADRHVQGVAVISGKEQLDAANEKLPAAPLEIHSI
ncbi:MAG: insulinase family protein [Deltaproteobacteria bacterium]|nr:insulinase family protein [Deltaproteobacteria bacterium]